MPVTLSELERMDFEQFKWLQGFSYKRAEEQAKQQQQSR